MNEIEDRQGLNEVEKFILVEALENELKKLTSTKDPNSFRNHIVGMAREKYESELASGMADKSPDLFMRGEKVGKLTLVYGEGKPEEVKHKLAVRDYMKLAKWFDEIPDEAIRDYVALNLGDFARYAFGRTGEIADGCEIEEIHYAAIPPQFKYAQVRVDGAKVAEVMGGLLGPTVAGFLGGAE